MQANIRWSERLVGVEVACIPGCLFVSGQSVYQADSLGLRHVHLYHSNLLISAKTAEKKLYPRGHNLTAEIARVAESAQTEKTDISTWQCGTTCRGLTRHRALTNLNALPMLVSESGSPESDLMPCN